MARPSVTSAAKGGKNAKKQCKKKTKKRCKQDTAACRATLEAYCATLPSPPACLVALACCDSCSANGYVTCTLAVQ